MKTVKLTIRLHIDTKQKLEHIAKTRGLTMTEVLESYIETDYHMNNLLSTITEEDLNNDKS